MTESCTFIFQFNQNSSPLAAQSAHRVENQKPPVSSAHERLSCASTTGNSFEFSNSNWWINSFCEKSFFSVKIELNRDLKIRGQRRQGKRRIKKVNSNYFSLYRDYSNSLTFSNVGELSCCWIVMIIISTLREIFSLWLCVLFGILRGRAMTAAVLDLQWRIQGGRGLGGSGPPLFLDQAGSRRTENIFLVTGPSLPYLGVWMTGPPPYLVIWNWHWLICIFDFLVTVAVVGS